jgi:hypothetical protein
MEVAYKAVVDVYVSDRTFRVDLLSESVQQCIRLPRGRGVTWRKCQSKGLCNQAILRASDQWHAENPGKRLATGAELRAGGLARDARRKYGTGV